MRQASSRQPTILRGPVPQRRASAAWYAHDALWQRISHRHHGAHTSLLRRRHGPPVLGQVDATSGVGALLPRRQRRVRALGCGFSGQSSRRPQSQTTRADARRSNRARCALSAQRIVHGHARPATSRRSRRTHRASGSPAIGLQLFHQSTDGCVRLTDLLRQLAPLDEPRRPRIGDVYKGGRGGQVVCTNAAVHPGSEKCSRYFTHGSAFQGALRLYLPVQIVREIQRGFHIKTAYRIYGHCQGCRVAHAVQFRTVLLDHRQS